MTATERFRVHFGPRGCLERRDKGPRPQRKEFRLRQVGGS